MIGAQMFKPLMLVLAFIATIIGANWLVAEVGPVPVGFGLIAPAGVYLAGFGFVLRDLLQESTKRPVLWVLGAIAVGALVSFLMGTGTIAVAGATAFLVSELLDFGVFSALRRRFSFGVGAVISNIAGAITDSLVFLSLAFGSLAFLNGQVVGKLWITALFVLGYAVLRQRRRVSC